MKGKVISLNHGEGHKILIIEQKGKDVWRGGAKSVDEAIEMGVAGIGVDSVVLQRAQRLEIPMVAVVIEELNLLAMSPIEAFFANEGVRTRSNWNGRAIRILDLDRLQHKFLKPPLRKRKVQVIE